MEAASSFQTSKRTVLHDIKAHDNIQLIKQNLHTWYVEQNRATSI
jgi:hypothetical protein